MHLMVTPKEIITFSYQWILIMITHKLSGSMSHIKNGDSIVDAYTFAIDIQLGQV